MRVAAGLALAGLAPAIAACQPEHHGPGPAEAASMPTPKMTPAPLETAEGPEAPGSAPSAALQPAAPAEPAPAVAPSGVSIVVLPTSLPGGARRADPSTLLSFARRNAGLGTDAKLVSIRIKGLDEGGTLNLEAQDSSSFVVYRFMRWATRGDAGSATPEAVDVRVDARGLHTPEPVTGAGDLSALADPRCTVKRLWASATRAGVAAGGPTVVTYEGSGSTGGAPNPAGGTHWRLVRSEGPTPFDRTFADGSCQPTKTAAPAAGSKD